MSRYLHLAMLLCILAGGLTACRKPVPDYTSPFYKVFEGECKGRKYIVHLYRLPSMDTFYGPRYSGTLYDAEEQAPMQFEGNSEKDRPQYFSGGWSERIHFEINAAGDALTGQIFLGVRDSLRQWKDSGVFAAKEVTMPVAFQYFGAAGFRYYDTSLESSPECRYQYGILRPTLADTVVRKKVHRHISEFFNAPDTAAQPAQWLADADYDAFVRGFAELTDTERKERFQWSSSNSLGNKTSEIVFAGKRWLSVMFSQVTSGGAHEQYFTKYVVYDLLTGNRLRLRDVLTADGMRKLSPLLAAELRRQYNLSPGQSLTKAGLNENSIAPGDNFYVTERGIGFFYNTYEIASFAAGTFNLFLPFSNFSEGDLAPLFREGA